MHAVHISYIITRQAMYVQRRTEARLCNHCCRAQAINITYSEDVFVALRIQHAMQTRRTYCHLRSVRLCDIFPHYLINGTIFEQKEVG
jgi:hypothetical protein